MEKAPTPVNVVGADPALVMPVSIIDDKSHRPIPGKQNQRNDPSLPARTTFEEDLNTASQRRVNLIWEYTQAMIAIGVVISTMVSSLLATYNTAVQIPNLMAVAFGTVVGFYFSRTNHQAIGGMGVKANETQEYRGR